jgi:acyl carrier protein
LKGAGNTASIDVDKEGKMKSVLEILSSIRPEADFAGSKDFFEEGLLDSFDLITLVSALEEDFSIRIDGLAIVPENFSSVAAIEGLVAESEKKK